MITPGFGIGELFVSFIAVAFSLASWGPFASLQDLHQAEKY